MIFYKGNRYTVPFGIYETPETKVILSEDNGNLVICNSAGVEIARHQIPATRGNLVRNLNHLRDNTLKIKSAIKEAVSWFAETELAEKFIEKVHKVYPRYIRDQIGLLKKTLKLHGLEKTSTAMRYCMEHNIFSIVDLLSVANKIKFSQAPEETLPPSSGFSSKGVFGVEKRSLDVYQEVMSSE